MSRPPFEELRRRLEEVGFRPSKTRGQNFLVDPGLCRAVAECAPDLNGGWVLEVGVGLGFLTSELLARGARVLGVEIDGRLADIAREVLGDPPELELLVADALAGKHRLAPELAQRLPRTQAWHLVANLPYGVASPLIALLARLEHPPSSLTVLVQEEVAERLVAGPGDPQRGALSVRVQALYRGRVVRRVPAGAFRPRPRVESAVARLDWIGGPPPSAEVLERLDSLVGALFGQRRKHMRNTLAGLVGDPALAQALLEEEGIDPAARPETIPTEAFLGLARRLAGSGAGTNSGSQARDPRSGG